LLLKWENLEGFGTKKTTSGRSGPVACPCLLC